MCPFIIFYCWFFIANFWDFVDITLKIPTCGSLEASQFGSATCTTTAATCGTGVPAPCQRLVWQMFLDCKSLLHIVAVFTLYKFPGKHICRFGVFGGHVWAIWTLWAESQASHVSLIFHDFSTMFWGFEIVSLGNTWKTHRRSLWGLQRRPVGHPLWRRPTHQRGVWEEHPSDGHEGQNVKHGDGMVMSCLLSPLAPPSTMGKLFCKDRSNIFGPFNFSL